ncbi:MAG: hypothetical protein Q9162_001278 [Coniocarpon cinnabarinum]
MEHLFFYPDEDALDEEALRVVECKELEGNVGNSPPLDHPVQWTTYEWLGFDHDRKPEPQAVGTFSEYASSRGWKLSPSGIDAATLTEWLEDPSQSRALHASLQDPSVTDAEVQRRFAAFIQSWLTFGLIEHVCQVSLKLSYLTRIDQNGVRIFDSRNLVYLLRAQKHIFDKLSKEGQNSRFEQAQLALNQHRRLVWEFGRYWQSLVYPNLSFARKRRIEDLPDHLRLWISSLKYILGLAVKMQDILLYVIDDVSAFERQIHVTHANPSWLVREDDDPRSDELACLIRAGFCRASCFGKLDSMSLTTQHWLKWWMVHASPDRFEDHSPCSRTTCQFERSPDFGPSHTETCAEASCPPNRPDFDDIAAAIEGGRIPLLQLEQAGKSSDLRLKVVSVQDLTTVRYYAFSHVWRYGLGSDTERGLPNCQVQSLWDIMCKPLFSADQEDATVRRSRSPLFWIDALCIPQSPELRQTAIRSINTIFRASEGVIVIDKIFLKLSGITPFEHRLWTWLESVLARVLFIILSDDIWILPGRYFIKDASQPTGQRQKRILRAYVKQEFPKCIHNPLSLVHTELTNGNRLRAGLLTQVLKESNEDKSEPVRLVRLTEEIEARATSRATDEAFILAAAHNMDLAQFVNEPTARRMQLFYESLGHVPTFWLFRGSPTIPHEPFTWAPVTLMSKHTLTVADYFASPDKLCRVTREGATATFAVATLEESTSLSWHSRDSNFSPLEVQLGPQTWHGKISDCVTRGTEKREKRYEALASSEGSQYDMVIFQHELDVGDLEYHRINCLLARFVDTTPPESMPEEVIVRCQVQAPAVFSTTHSEYSETPGKTLNSVYRPAQKLCIVGNARAWQDVTNCDWTEK